MRTPEPTDHPSQLPEDLVGLMALLAHSDPMQMLSIIRLVPDTHYVQNKISRLIRLDLVEPVRTAGERRYSYRATPKGRRLASQMGTKAPPRTISYVGTYTPAAWPECRHGQNQFLSLLSIGHRH